MSLDWSKIKKEEGERGVNKATNALLGAGYHNWGHFYTDEKVVKTIADSYPEKKYATAIRIMAGIFEDMRVEYLAGSKLALAYNQSEDNSYIKQEVKEKLNDFARFVYLGEKKIDKIMGFGKDKEEKSSDLFMNYLIYYLRVNSRKQDFLIPALDHLNKKMSEYFDEYFLEKTNELLEKVTTTIREPENSTEKMAELSVEVLDLIKNILEDKEEKEQNQNSGQGLNDLLDAMENAEEDDYDVEEDFNQQMEEKKYTGQSSSKDYDSKFMTDNVFLGEIEPGKRPFVLTAEERSVSDNLQRTMAEIFRRDEYEAPGYANSGKFAGDRGFKLVTGDYNNMWKRQNEVSQSIAADIYVLLDGSGSMSGELIKQAKKALALLTYSVKSLNDQLGVSSYDNPLKIGAGLFAGLNNGSGLYTLFGIEDDLDYAMRVIEKVEANGGTPVQAGLLGGLLNISRFPNFENSDNRKFIIMISDGAPSDPMDSCVKLVENIKETGISLLGIGINSPAIYDVFGQDNAVNISRVEQLGGILGDVLLKVANQEKIDMTKINSKLNTVKFKTRI
jgi:uncharacterized protein YegL